MKLRRHPGWRPGRDDLEIVFVAMVDRGEVDDPLVVETVRVSRVPPVKAPRGDSFVRVVGWTIAAVIGIVVLLVWDRLMPPGPNGRIAAFAVVCAGGLGMLLWHAWHERPAQRHEHAGEGCCRRCGYGLGGASSGVNVTVEGAEHDLGPRRCPECSQHWPLIFPL